MRCIASVLVLSCVSSVSLSGEGVGGYYYVTDSNQTVYVIHGTKVVNSFPTINPNQGSVYVYGDVVCTVDNQTIYGGFYTLDGTPTGETFTNPSPGIPILDDSATDGENAYAFSVLAQDLMIHDMDYSNRAPVFNFHTNQHGLRYSGLAIDPVENAFWFSGNSSSLLDQYDEDENLLRSNDIGFNNTRALAFDPTDETLWLIKGGTNELYQFSRDGELLNTLIPEGLPVGQYLGGDINLAPSDDCPGDFNGDGTLNFLDISDFLDAFSSGCE